MKSSGCTLFQRLWKTRWLDTIRLWKPNCSTKFTKKDTVSYNKGLLTAQDFSSRFRSTSWKHLLKGGLLLLTPCLISVTNPIWNDSDASLHRKNLTSRDLLEAAKEAANAIESKSNCIMNLYSVASQSSFFSDTKRREELAIEALSLADRWAEKLQSCLSSSSQFPKVSWKKWVVDIGSITLALLVSTCVGVFIVPILCGHWHRLKHDTRIQQSCFSVRGPMWIFSFLIGLVASLVYSSWTGVDSRYYRLKQDVQEKGVQSTLDNNAEELSNWEEDVQDENVRHALLQLEEAAFKEQDAMEKYNVLQSIISAPLEKEEQRLLEEYQYRISQAQEEIANAEARWNRWMLGIRRLDILEAIGLSTATQIAQLCDEYDQYYHLHRELGVARWLMNLWSLSLVSIVGICVDNTFQRYFSEKEETLSLTTWSSILLGWISSILVKDLLELLKEDRIEQEIGIWIQRAQKRMDNWLEFRKKPEWKLQ